MDETSKSLGDRLLWLRSVSGLTQQQVADLVGRARGGIAMIESGDRRDIRSSTLSALAGLYGVDEQYLLRGGPLPDQKSVRTAALRAALAGPKRTEREKERRSA